MADSLHNSCSLTDSTVSTIFRLDGSSNTILDEFLLANFNGLNESTKSNNSTHGSSIQLTDSSHTIDDFPGFAQGDDCPDKEMKDPFNDVFYHISPLKDSTNIIFYNRPLYESILTGLSKEFADFPSQSAKKFRVKTHVDGLQCILTMERSLMSLCASGAGHSIWKEKNFKKLSENMYRSFVKDTDSVLNTSLLDQDKESLSASQVSTQPNQSGLITIMEEAREDTPGVIRIQQPPDSATDPQDTPVMRRICILMDMIHSLQGGVKTMQDEIRTLTKEVNDLASQAVYRTVDETRIADTSRETVIETINETKLSDGNGSKGLDPISEPSTPYSEALQGPTAQNEHSSNRPLRAEVPQLGTEDIQRTSTPKVSNQADWPRSAPRTSEQRDQRRRKENRPETNSQPPQPRSDSTKKVLLIGDSVISPVNPKGLKKEVFKHSISGANIDHIFDQSNIFDMSKFSDVIIFVGGNDASKGADMEYFEELYEQVILNLKKDSEACKIYLCNMSPRSDADTVEVNQVIHRLCQEHSLTMVDINKAFHDKRGKVIERYYGDDLIHLSTSGVKRLLGEINEEINIVDDFENCAFNHRYQKRGRIQKRSSRSNSQNSTNVPRRRGRPTQSRDNNTRAACYKCGETNHETIRCRHKEQLKCHDCGYFGHKSGRCLNQ